ncbi:hypothetical protein BGP_6236 [Beggiatoa sp. PS]|nr:hypothetical protein BGP_6236 [Beggiatoa sp. PS]
MKPLQEGYQAGLECGDFEFACYSAFEYGIHAYHSGIELTILEGEIANYTQAFRQLKQETSVGYNEICWQAILNLMGKPKIHAVSLVKYWMKTKCCLFF